MAQTNPLARIARLVREEKSEISSVYFYAILSSLIQLSLPLGLQAIIGFILGGAMSTSLAILIMLVVLGVLTNGILQMNQMKIIERIQQKIFVRYSFAFTNHIPRLDLQKIDSYYLPELVNRFFDIPVLQKSLSKILLDFPIAVTQILLGLALLSFYHPAFIFFGVFLILLLSLIFYVTGDKGFQTSIEKSNYKYEVAGWLEEMARVIKQFKFSAHHALHERKADEKVVGYVKARKKHFSILLVQFKVLIALKVIVTAAMLIVGCFLLLEQQINIGQFVAAEIVIIIVINAVEKLITNLDSVYSTLTSVEKINKLLDKPAEKEGSFSVDKASAFSVEFRNVSFAYQEDRLILNNVSFSAKPGEKIALTGKDGSGKSTILKLLTGSYPEFKGSILINDVPIGNYNLEYLRSHTGIVLNQQDVFAGTVWENIALGDENADKAYITRVVQSVGLSGYISNLREGFDTVLDPTGKRLPKNVVKKIMLARALAHKPKLLLLDEPWEGIDDTVKQEIQHFLLNEVDATLLIATNDSDFIRQTDHTIAI